ncbi:MAG: ATP/GTP-binding protein [Flammeovirgaceae bacterium]|nr:ATP/GTP-binding protein [Flammeovirgaceae bacterium]
MKYLCILSATLFIACQPAKKEPVETPKAPTLTLKWETDTVLTTCESVIYDKQNDMLYVANISGAPDGKDGNGFISKLTLDGKVSVAQWVTGMDAPKGMGIYNGKLFVTDIDRIHEIDIASGKITNTYPVEGAKFLNDITIDESGKVYVSDMSVGNILLLENGAVTLWLSGLNGPNGLLAEGSTLQMASFSQGTFSTIDANKQITQRADSIENGDGVEAVGDGAYLVSSWNGMVHYVDADGIKTIILDTRADSVNAADIEYIAGKKLLLVPGFFKNKVMAYELSK